MSTDEKWVHYKNVIRKHSWLKKGQKAKPTAKPDLHPRKRMLSIFWDTKGIIHYEFLPKNVTMTGELYAEILERVNQALKKKRPQKKAIIFHQDNATPHYKECVKVQLKKMKWDILKHPAYSPDLSETDYCINRSLDNFNRGKDYGRSDEAMEQGIKEWIASKEEAFFRDGIEQLPVRWQATVDCEGDYFDEEDLYDY